MQVLTNEQANENIKQLLHNLSDREREYWNMIRPNSGVLNLIGKPGTFKTAILRSIAKKLNLLYIDHRLTTMDETDLGCYPKTKQRGEFEVIYYPIPEWAIDAKEALSNGYNGVLICWEELNRANSFLRNAALKILLEKEIGVKFKFPEHVFMCATGNLGLDDDTDVEEYDAALKTRIITFEHDPGVEEWVKDYAQEHIHKDILKFITTNPSFYYPNFTSDNAKTITNPRTWTFLSDYIVTNYGKDGQFEEYKEMVSKYGVAYINPADVIEFVKFTHNYYKISLNDILKNKKNVLSEANFRLLDRDISMRLLNELKHINILQLDKNEIKNVIKFLELVEPDNLMSFIYEMSGDKRYDMSEFKDTVENNINKIYNAFPTYTQALYDKVFNNESTV